VAISAQGELLGGLRTVGDFENDAHTQQIAQFAVQQLSQREGQELTLDHIESVHKQVVTGTNYQLVLVASNQAGQSQRYEVSVYEPLPQLNEPLQLQKSQKMADKKMLGGAKELSASDPDVVAAAKFATEQLSQQSNSLLPFELKEVVSAHSRVVNGVIYDLELKLAQGKREENYKVEVVRSPGEEHTLKSSTKAASTS
jgi:hypothetical protein